MVAAVLSAMLLGPLSFPTAHSAPSATSQLVVDTVDATGASLSGYSVVVMSGLNQSASVIGSGSSPAVFTLRNDINYTVTVSGSGSCTFDHWFGGTTSPYNVTPASAGDNSYREGPTTQSHDAINGTMYVTAVLNCGTPKVVLPTYMPVAACDPEITPNACG